jgi:hydrogenase expression/formation protein HypD
MKYVDEYRDEAAAVTASSRRSAGRATKPWTLMEVCGGQTHTLVKFGHRPACFQRSRAGPRARLPRLRHAARDDRPRHRHRRPPGGHLHVLRRHAARAGLGTDLLSVKARPGDVRIVYSPLDAVKLARMNPDREVVFFAVGFETTAPANAMAVHQARQLGLRNFSILVSHVLVPPAMEAILSSPDNRVQGFLAAGHVCAIMGYWEYEPLAARYQRAHRGDRIRAARPPPGHSHDGGDAGGGTDWGVENQYTRAVQHAMATRRRRSWWSRSFRVTDRKWRGIGEIPGSGLALREHFASSTHRDPVRRRDDHRGGARRVHQPAT